MTPGSEGREPAVRPVLTVLTPDATDEEIAALVSVFATRVGAPPDRPRIPDLWNAPYRQVRVSYSHGAGGWRASAMPKHRGR